MKEDKLNDFIGQMLHDLGGAYGISLVRMGNSLGLYRTLYEQGPLTFGGLAKATGLAERYVREWLSYNVASNYIVYSPQTQDFTLPEEQAMVLAIKDSPVYMVPAFDTAAAMLDNQPLIEAAFHTGDGVGWGNQSGCLFCAVAGLFRPGYRAHLVADWLPALDGVVEKLERGAKVADIGCGHGHSTLLMAEAFPNSQFIGFDFHAASIDQARAHVDHHKSDNLRFELGSAKDFPGDDYDLITCFDCLHDMGDPAGAARHIRRRLKDDGTWLIVEPFAQDRLEDNLNSVGRIYYAASTMICIPTSLDQEVGSALGAQAGPKKLRKIVVDEGGFTSFDCVAETPFNLILEARP
nr:class I SAM-dependent methyltransferase [uncultured Halomonas sp.]